MQFYNNYLSSGSVTALPAPTPDGTGKKYPTATSFLNPNMATSWIREFETVLSDAGLTEDVTLYNQLSTAIGVLGGGASSPVYTPQTTGFTATFGSTYLCKVGGGGFTATLPITPAVGDDGKSITFIKSDPALGGNTLTVARNGENIMGLAEDLLIEASDGENIKITFVWDDTASEWVTAV